MGEDGILRSAINLPGAEVCLEDAEEIIAATARISQYKKLPLLIVNAEGQKSISRDARMYLIENNHKVNSAITLVTNSLFVKIISSFIISLNDKRTEEKIPIKLFATEKMALEWLKKFRN